MQPIGDNGFCPQVTVEGERSKGFVRILAEGLGISDLAARLLCARGITDLEEAHRFLHPKLEHLSDPFLLPDAKPAVERVVKALRHNERICLYGDYDADGVTSVAILSNFLSRLGISPEIYIPERQEGYGLHVHAVEKLSQAGVSLLICLDCGSSSIEEIEYARQQGIDVVVIDHHEPPARLPSPVALVNPKRADSRFPTRDLAACGVTFFFVLALRRILHNRNLLNHRINLKEELDLVTVGSMGDMVPLVKDNRIMVKFGMETMRKNPRPWLKAFFSEKIIYRNTADEYILNFVIVPRINAAGRISDPQRAFAFLTSVDDTKARALLLELNQMNRERQKIEEDIVREITNDLEREGLNGRKSIVLYNEGWHIGVIGIVAQKVAERFGKPAIIFTRAGDCLKGSGRGCEGMDLFSAVACLSPLLLKYGGHKYACGISIAEENLALFANAFDEAVDPLIKTQEQIHRVDAHAAFDELTLDLIRFLKLLSPFGMGNPRPNLLLTPTAISSSDRFVKIVDTSNRTWYGSLQGDCSLSHNGSVRIVATPVLREQRGRQFIHLNIRGIVPVP